MRFAINADKALDAKTQAVYVSTWADGFADIEPNMLKTAFIACLRSHTFKTMPTIGDIRQHLERAEDMSADEKAAQKWQEVRDYIRLHYHPDLGASGPRISERTRRAINAAGGLTYLSECGKENLVFARKRFIESYLRWQELTQDEYLLPEGELKNLLEGAAANLSVERLLDAPKVIEHDSGRH